MSEIRWMFHATAMGPDYDGIFGPLERLFGCRVLHRQQLEEPVGRDGGMTWLGDNSIEIGAPYGEGSSVATFVERLAQENPTVLAFEDMHDASSALFSFLDLLLDRVGAVPLTVVVAGRRELYEVRPGWGDRPGASTMHLEPLSDGEIAQLVAALRDRDTLPAEMARTFVDTDRPHTAFLLSLTDVLRQRGAEVLQGPADGAAVLDISADETGQRVLSVSARNIPREYEVYYAVTFSLRVGTETLIGNESLVVTRSYTYDETEVLAKAAEEQILREALASDLARRVLQRIQSLGATAALPPR